MAENGETAPATEEVLQATVDARDVRAAAFMGLLFVGSILVALLLARTFVAQDVPPVFEDPQSATNPLIYLGIVVIFTLVILVIARLGLKKVIQWVILAAVFFTIAYVFEPLIAHYVPGLSPYAGVLALTLGIALTGLLYVYPEWYVVDAVGVSVAAGATGIFGFSFGLFPALILLVGFALYDFIAVYRTEHMLDLADNVLELRLPIMLVVPKVRGYSFLRGETLRGPPPGSVDEPPWELDEARARELTEESARSRDALFMGLGDIVIPGVLVVSSFMFLDPAAASVSTVLGLSAPLFVALATLVGATLGFSLLMYMVLKGRAHAGLPSLNGGALAFFLAALLWLYGWGPLVPQF